MFDNHITLIQDALKKLDNCKKKDRKLIALEIENYIKNLDLKVQKKELEKIKDYISSRLNSIRDIRNIRDFNWYKAPIKSSSNWTFLTKSTPILYSNIHTELSHKIRHRIDILLSQELKECINVQSAYLLDVRKICTVAFDNHRIFKKLINAAYLELLSTKNLSDFWYKIKILESIGQLSIGEYKGNHIPNIKTKVIFFNGADEQRIRNINKHITKITRIMDKSEIFNDPITIVEDIPMLERYLKTYTKHVSWVLSTNKLHQTS